VIGLEQIIVSLPPCSDLFSGNYFQQTQKCIIRVQHRHRETDGQTGNLPRYSRSL